MHRFVISSDDIMGSWVYITGAEAAHLKKVLRLKPGDKVTVFDGNGREFLVELVEINEGGTKARILEVSDSIPEPPVGVTLIQGLSKGDKLEFIIQKGTELGVKRFIPVQTERTVVRLDDKKAAERQARWQRIALEASKQCRRAVIPQVEMLTGLAEAIAGLPQEKVLLVPWEGEHNRGLKEFLRTLRPGEKREIFVVIGPEGGLTGKEVELIINAGGYPVTLGSRILRTETAGIAAVTMILYELGDLGGK